MPTRDEVLAALWEIARDEGENGQTRTTACRELLAALGVDPVKRRRDELEARRARRSE